VGALDGDAAEVAVRLVDNVSEVVRGQSGAVRLLTAAFLSGGHVLIVSEQVPGYVKVSVVDDGVGIPEARLATVFDQGIGISNVSERLKVLFGSEYRMWIESQPGEGTRTQIEVPELQTGLVAVS